jgi:PKD repeat protein
MEEKVINNSSFREIPNVRKIYWIWHDNYLSVEKIKRQEFWRINKLNLKPGITPKLFNLDVTEWKWDESGTKSSNGGTFEKQLVGFVPKLNEWVESYLNEMVNRKMVIFIETFNDSVYLFGGEKCRAQFSFTKSINSRNGYELTFTTLSDESSLIINDEDFFPAPPDTGLVCEPVLIVLNGDELHTAASGAEVQINLKDQDDVTVVPFDVDIIDNEINITLENTGGATMTADFTADILVAEVGETITFTDASDNSPTDWAWDFNGQGSSFVQNPTFEFDSVGFKDITLLAAKNGVGDFITKSSYIEVVQDPIVTAFLTATSITDTTIISALTKLVYDLRVNNLLSKVTAIYPFVGGTATTHKFNLLDPQDTNAAYRLVFSGGWTHSAAGAKPNGTNASADTFLAPNVFGQNDVHVSVYLFSNIIQGLSVDMGSNSSFYLSADYVGGGLGLISNMNNTGTKSVSTVGLAISGYYIITRLLSTERKVYKNGNLLDTFTATSTTPSSTSILLASGVGSEFSPRGQSFVSIGTGLTSGESLLLNTIVSNFQQTLGRRL